MMAGAAFRQTTANLTPFEQLQIARDVVRSEAEALARLANRLPDDFCDAVDRIANCQGAVIVTGMGKAGWIGQKISASLASTGTRSHFLHPAEAFHGDLGRIAPQDIVLAFSNSGETAELLQIIPFLQESCIPVVAVTGNPKSSLAKHAVVCLDYGRTSEAGHLGLAPSTSTTVMLALGDAIALVVSRLRAFRDIDFAKFHPGGSLGRKLALVDEVMRPLSRCRVALETETVRQIYVRHGGHERRVGVILIVSDGGRLTGLFTDSDLARLLERKEDEKFDLPIAELMTRSPVSVSSGSKTALAIETLACRSLSELPVIDKDGKPIGLIDITDVINI